MKVKQLINKLKKLNQEADVVIDMGHPMELHSVVKSATVLLERNTVRSYCRSYLTKEDKNSYYREVVSLEH